MVDQGKFRMWYFAIHGAPHLTDLDLVQGSDLLLRKARDGLHWIKPALGQVEFHGSRANNIIDLPGDRLEGVNVIIDPDDPGPRNATKWPCSHNIPRRGALKRPRMRTGPPGRCAGHQPGRIFPG